MITYVRTIMVTIAVVWFIVVGVALVIGGNYWLGVPVYLFGCFLVYYLANFYFKFLEDKEK